MSQPDHAPQLDQPRPDTPTSLRDRPAGLDARSSPQHPRPGRGRGLRWSLGLGVGLGRRGFLAVLSTGAMTLGLTVLGWIPLARPARAEVGSEYPDCGIYSDGPGGPICLGAPYSPDYCGSDGWFRTGCYSTPGGQVCYQPRTVCRAGGRDQEARNAWRWVADGIEYRCADGRIYYEGSPNPDSVICQARLTPLPPPPHPAPPTTPSPEPTAPPRFPSRPASSSPPALPLPLPLPELSQIPQLPSVPSLTR